MIGHIGDLRLLSLSTLLTPLCQKTVGSDQRALKGWDPSESGEQKEEEIYVTKQLKTSLKLGLWLPAVRSHSIGHRAVHYRTEPCSAYNFAQFKGWLGFTSWVPLCAEMVLRPATSFAHQPYSAFTFIKLNYCVEKTPESNSFQTFN